MKSGKVFSEAVGPLGFQRFRIKGGGSSQAGFLTEADERGGRGVGGRGNDVCNLRSH